MCESRAQLGPRNGSYGTVTRLKAVCAPESAMSVSSSRRHIVIDAHELFMVADNLSRAEDGGRENATLFTPNLTRGHVEAR